MMASHSMVHVMALFRSTHQTSKHDRSHPTHLTIFCIVALKVISSKKFIFHMPHSALRHRPIESDTDGQSMRGIAPVAQRASLLCPRTRRRRKPGLARHQLHPALRHHPRPDRSEAESHPARTPAAPRTCHDRHACLVDGVVPGHQLVEYHLG
jgi:hypothetical protein